MNSSVFIYIAIMAGVTYLTRMLPMVILRREIKQRFLRSFLYYVPYAALAVMTFPGILFAASDIRAGLCALAAALISAFFRRSLIEVSLAACAAVFIAELLLGV